MDLKSFFKSKFPIKFFAKVLKVHILSNRFLALSMEPLLHISVVSKYSRPVSTDQIDPNVNLLSVYEHEKGKINTCNATYPTKS